MKTANVAQAYSASESLAKNQIIAWARKSFRRFGRRRRQFLRANLKIMSIVQYDAFVVSARLQLVQRSSVVYQCARSKHAEESLREHPANPSTSQFIDREDRFHPLKARNIVKCPECRDGRPAPCPACAGKKMQRCTGCAGRGRSICRACDGAGRQPCTVCEGAGKCPQCHGSNRIVCNRCNGRSSIDCECVSMFGVQANPCGRCRGTREVDCPNCGLIGLAGTVGSLEGGIVLCPNFQCSQGRCSVCEGRGSFVCSRCSGRSEVSCSDCGGAGSTLCVCCSGCSCVTCRDRRELLRYEEVVQVWKQECSEKTILPPALIGRIPRSSAVPRDARERIFLGTSTQLAAAALPAGVAGAVLAFLEGMIATSRGKFEVHHQEISVHCSPLEIMEYDYEGKAGCLVAFAGRREFHDCQGVLASIVGSIGNISRMGAMLTALVLLALAGAGVWFALLATGYTKWGLVCPDGMNVVLGGSRDGEKIESFCMDVTEVTTSSYLGCAECPFLRADERCNGEYDVRGTHPVNCVSWSQAGYYCLKRGGRLPTRSEQYLAIHGREDRPYPWGLEEPSCDRIVMSDAEAGGAGCGRHATWPVGSRPSGSTADGIADLFGNVQEWNTSSFFGHGDTSWMGVGGGSFNDEFRVFDCRHPNGLCENQMASPTMTGKGSIENGFRCVAEPWFGF